ncbi:hypothetical protein B0O99DRAFT_633599 [Bisporella sp. PMI_857]|nr:hypothetical protein B0O99DRAFT_633599 [Bisporella sp. PMI_857]
MERIRTGLALQAPVPQPRIASYAGVNRNPVDSHPVPARLNETIAPPWDLESQNLINAANKARDAQIAEAKKAQANAEKFARQANKRIADWKEKVATARGRDDGTQTDGPLVKQVGTQTNSVQIDATHDAVQGVVAHTAKGQNTSAQSGLRRSTRNTSKPATTAEPASVVPTILGSAQFSTAQNMVAPLTRSASVQANETQSISITTTRPTSPQASLPRASGGPSMKPILAQTGTTRASTARATRSASKLAGPVQASAPRPIPTQAGSSTTSKKRARSEVEADDELAESTVAPVAGPATAPKLKRRRKENLYDAETDPELSDEIQSPKKKAPARAKTIAKAKANTGAGAATDTSQSGKRGRFKPDDERAQLEMVGKRQCNCCYGVFDLENFRMHTTKGVTKRVLYCQDCQDKKATSRKVKREGGQAEGGDREEEVGGDEEGQ